MEVQKYDGKNTAILSWLQISSCSAKHIDVYNKTPPYAKKKKKEGGIQIIQLHEMLKVHYCKVNEKQYFSEGFPVTV